ncbi:hypothetical protein BGZ76_009871 [Entomortierella beljakovae]|nr:hypothetical protein BGZ76_009871 [Entomortierella beljakovae]
MHVIEASVAYEHLKMGILKMSKGLLVGVGLSKIGGVKSPFWIKKQNLQLFIPTLSKEMYTTSNFRYLRISKTKVLPVNLLLSKDDLEWFNDYSFQEVLSILKPLVLGHVDLYEKGHIIKKSTITSNSDDGLDDAGVVFGTNINDGISGQDTRPGVESSKGNKRRGATATGGKGINRPQFTVRYGMKQIMNSERGGAVLIADKNLGFAAVKKEQLDDSNLHDEPSQRSQTGLAALEGEEQSQDREADVSGVVIREEDESDNLRVSDFAGGDVGGDQDTEDNEYQEREAKRKQTGSTGKSGRKGKRPKLGEEVSSSQSDQKPTLQVNYSSLKTFPQTLYIVVRSVDSKEPSILPFTIPMPIADSSSYIDSTKQSPEDDSLFPPGMDYFLS